MTPCVAFKNNAGVSVESRYCLQEKDTTVWKNNQIADLSCTYIVL